MLDMVATCKECKQSWDTWMGNNCPKCGTPLPPEIAAEADRIASENFRSMMRNPPPAPKLTKFQRLLNWLGF